MSRLRKAGQSLIGEYDEVPLQARVYHFICIATIAVMFYVLLFSMATGMISYAVITALLIPFQLFLFYLSRFKNQAALSVNTYVLLIHGFFVVSYRLSAGISGSTLLSFCIVFFLSTALVPSRHYFLLFLVNLGTVGMLLVTEYNNPAFVLTHYSGRAEHFIDIASTYAVTITLILAGLWYLIRHYTLEKVNAEERAVLLDELHEEKAQLIAVISHDYYTPLAAFQHYLNVLEQPGLSTEQRQTYTSEMRQTVMHTQSLLANLLDMTKQYVEPDTYATEATFTVSEAVSGTLAVYKDIAQLKGQQIHISVPEKLQMNANKHLFTTIIRNLINNAIKFCPNEATIRFCYEALDGNHVFIVEDDGPGIAPQREKEIRESWQHLARNVSRSGTVGLVLSKKCAVALGATLDFETPPGRGRPGEGRPGKDRPGNGRPPRGTSFTLKIPARNS